METLRHQLQGPIIVIDGVARPLFFDHCLHLERTAFCVALQDFARYLAHNSTLHRVQWPQPCCQSLLQSLFVTLYHFYRQFNDGANDWRDSWLNNAVHQGTGEGRFETTFPIWIDKDVRTMNHFFLKKISFFCVQIYDAIYQSIAMPDEDYILHLFAFWLNSNQWIRNLGRTVKWMKWYKLFIDEAAAKKAVHYHSD